MVSGSLKSGPNLGPVADGADFFPATGAAVPDTGTVFVGHRTAQSLGRGVEVDVLAADVTGLVRAEGIVVHVAGAVGTVHVDDDHLPHLQNSFSTALVADGVGLTVGFHLREGGDEPVADLPLDGRDCEGESEE